MRSASIVVAGVGLMCGVLALPGCGSGVSPSVLTGPTPSATDYVVVDPPTTTVPTTPPPPSTDASGAIITTTTLPTDYVVRANDSVYKIAARFGLDPQVLADLNGWDDGVKHTILPGDTILIRPPTVSSVPTSESVPTSAGECPISYTIQAGDTTRIAVADRFGITYEEMDAANVDTPGYDSFVVGTEITIPCPG